MRKLLFASVLALVPMTTHAAGWYGYNTDTKTCTRSMYTPDQWAAFMRSKFVQVEENHRNDYPDEIIVTWGTDKVPLLNADMFFPDLSSCQKHGPAEMAFMKKMVAQSWDNALRTSRGQ